MSDNLQQLLNDIPIAQDGHIINSEYHNSLRTVLVVLAKQLEVPAVSQTITLTFAPSFLANSNEKAWNLTTGVATMPTVEDNGGANATGWLPLQLPDGARLQGIIVSGRRSGEPTGGVGVFIFRVKLLRYTINDPDQSAISLVSLPLKDAPDPFQQPGLVQISGAGPAALEEYRRVDNKTYKYVIEAVLKNGTANMFVQISAIQITFDQV